MNPLQLALRVLRADRRSLVSAVCTLFGVAIAVTLVSWLAAVPGALDARALHEAWRTPATAEESNAGVLVKPGQDRFREQTITRIDVAALKPDAPAAPGLLRVPQPGEVLLSPALAQLARDLPADQLAKRFPGKVIAELGDQALVYPGELVAVVGLDQNALAEQGARPAAGLVSRHNPQPEFILLLLSQVGLVVLVVPSLVLIASSARLTAARRERRLASLRLAGATPGQVVAITVAEIAIATILGTLLGLLLGPVARGLSSQLPWDGGTWFAADLEPSWLLTLGIAIGTPLLVCGAAVFGLRRVLTAPLGAAQQHSRKAPSAWRLLALVFAAVAFAVGIGTASATGGTSVVVGALAAIALAASVVGPWLTAVVGRVFTKVWRRPSTLLAGRRLRDDPKAAYRAASGVVLAVFTGCLALTVLPSMEQKVENRVWGPWKQGVLYTTVSAEQAPTAAERLRVELAKRGVNSPVGVAATGSLKNAQNVYAGQAIVLGCQDAGALMWLAVGECGGAPGLRVGKDQVLPPGPLSLSTYGDRDESVTPLPANAPVHQMSGETEKSGGTILVDPALIPHGAQLKGYTLTVMTSPANAELVRTLLIEQVPGGRIGSLEAFQGRDNMQVADMRRIAMIGLIIAGLLGGISAAITAAGSVVDRRRTLAALIAAGTPVRVLARALRTEAALPALVATLGAGIAGLVVGAGLMTIARAPLTLNLWLVTPLVVGFGVAVVAASACGPLLRRISPQSYAEE